MKTYIINLKEAVERKEYMNQQFALLPPSLSVEFVEAVDGRVMSEAKLNEKFDSDKFRIRYTKKVRPGEIGCTLSHQKCYRRLVESGEPYVLILEDDLVVRQNWDTLVPEIENLLNTDEPHIVLLSGWYWYLGTRKLKGHYRLATVYDGFLTHAYAINRSAASLLIERRPFTIADDWFYIRKKGVELYAILPHLLDQDWSGQFSTSINRDDRKKCSGLWRRKIEVRFHSFYLKILRIMGRFEKP